MKEYHKIQTVYKRDMNQKPSPLIEGAWTKPEFEFLQNAIWFGTEKIDGTNIRVMWRDDDHCPVYNPKDVEFRGKTDRAQMPPLLLKRLNTLFTKEKMADTFGETEVCLYGEGFGGKIQKGGNYGDHDYILFDVKIGNFWLQRQDVEQVAEKLEIKVVPVVFYGTLHQAIDKVKLGFKSYVAEKDYTAEGLILQPRVQLFTRQGKRIITKIKHKDFQNTVKLADFPTEVI